MMSGIKKIVFLFFLYIQTTFNFAQIAPGEWRTHFSYNNVNQVEFAGDKVYAEASNKLYSYSNSGIIETYSTLTGLNGHNVSLIGWCEAEKTLIIVYDDGNIDFLTKSGIVNLSDFKNKSLTAEKTLFGLRIDGELAYLSTGIGLLVIDVKKLEIRETFILNLSSAYTDVFDVASWGDTLLIATESGLYGGDTASNLQDVSYWSQMPFVPGTKARKIVRFNGRLYALAENGIVYQKSGSDWSVFINDNNASKLRVQNGYLFICASSHTYMCNSAMDFMNVESILNNDIAMDPDRNLLYIASGSNGLNKLEKIDTQYQVSSQSSIIPNGPASKTAWNGFFKDGIYYATTGARWASRFFYPGDILVFNDEKWSNLNNKQDILNKTGIPMWDFMNLAIDPIHEGHYFITSWGEGLYEFKDSAFYKLHTNKNSPLISAVEGDSTHYIKVDGAVFDEDNNLWVMNSYENIISTGDALKILKPDGTWLTPHYSNLPGSPTWNNILFTRNHQVWMNAVRYKYGIFVLDYKNTLEDTSDDRTKWIDTFTDQDDNILSLFTIDCITEDLKGTIWIGTVYGPLLASNPSAILTDPDYRFTRIKIPRNDGTENADYLLNDIRINCITVDGANRKWIGTNGYGVYLVSEDGQKTIHHFDMGNSPLPSVYIWSITINPETGEVFIGTDTGLVSYRSDATQSASSFSHVYVFPNPVKPEYSGNITVTGLMENTQVKITDMAGNILVAGRSLGGQFTWNSYTKQGKRAASGVYLVLCASEDGSEYQACKFMIIN